MKFSLSFFFLIVDSIQVSKMESETIRIKKLKVNADFVRNIRKKTVLTPQKLRSFPVKVPVPEVKYPEELQIS